MTEEVHPRLALPLPLHFPAVVVEDAERIEATLLTSGAVRFVVRSVAVLVFLLHVGGVVRPWRELPDFGLLPSP